MIKRILIVFGTRPEAIKMAPLVKEFQKYPSCFEVKVCVTAQHRQMLDQVLGVFNIIPDYDLNIMAPNQDLFDITSKVLLGLRPILKQYLPDIVFVHGDTTTSMATAMAAFYEKIKVGHVEAGLRTNNIKSPWPEEMNRQVTDRICEYYFAPTVSSKENLVNENVEINKILVTGNTIVDALIIATNMIKSDDDLEKSINIIIDANGYKINSRKYILITGHRRENFGEGFINICKALKKIALQNPLFDIVYPVHLNPNVQKPVYEMLSNIPNIYLIPPLDYLPFIYLMQNSFFILTDSGGIQEEAPSLGKPVLVMRDNTERPEAIDAGTAIIIGTKYKDILLNVNKLINDPLMYMKMANSHNPYGDGKACERIVESFMEV